MSNIKVLCSFAFLFLFISIICCGCSNFNVDIPDKGHWVVAEDTMDKPRSPATANLLPDGNVLIMGGLNDSADTAEIFDPNQMKIVKSIPLNDGRFYDYSATSLLNGDVFIAGGYVYENRRNHNSTNQHETNKELYLTNTTKIFDSKTYEFKDTKNLKYKMANGNLAQLLSNGNVLLLSNTILTDISRENFRFQIYDPTKNDYYEVKNMMHRIKVGVNFFNLNNGDIIFHCYWAYPNKKCKGCGSWCLYNVNDNKFEIYPDDLPYEILFIQLDNEKYLSIQPFIDHSSGYTYNINTKEKIPVNNNIPKTWRAGTKIQSVLLDNGNVLILGINANSIKGEEKNRKLADYHSLRDKYSAYIYDKTKNIFYEVSAPPYPVYEAGIIKLKNGDILVAGGSYLKDYKRGYSNKIQIFKYKH